MRFYGKLRLKAWHKAIITIFKNYQVARQSKKSQVELSPIPKTCNVGLWILIGCPVKHGPRGWASLLPRPDDYAMGPLVLRFHWLANRSHVFRCLDPHKRRSRKGNRQIKGWFRAPKTWSLSPSFPPLLLYPESSTWPFLPKLICSRKTRGKLLSPVNLSLLTPNWNPLLYMIFNHCIKNKCCVILFTQPIRSGRLWH